MITTTVGRKVWYRPNAYDVSGPGGMQCAPNAPLDATVVCVHSDRMVNLVIFDCNGHMHRRCSVRLLQDDDLPHDGQSYAEWMPYQTAQAKKETAA
jgi:hypothetical protein